VANRVLVALFIVGAVFLVVNVARAAMGANKKSKSDGGSGCGGGDGGASHGACGGGGHGGGGCGGDGGGGCGGGGD
jgi:hypothetical protein